jgi:hypothetical protein
LDALNSSRFKKTEPVRHVEPKHAAQEGEDTPRNYVTRLIGLAKDGNGKLTLPQIRWELQDKSITMPDILGWFAAYAVDVRVEQRPGNTLYLHFGQGKRQVKNVNSELVVLGDRRS